MTIHATRFWANKIRYSATNLLDPGFRQAPKVNGETQQKVSIVFHAYHLDLAQQIFQWIENFAEKSPLPVELVVTTPAKFAKQIQGLSHSTNYSSELLVVENHGRDVWPFLQVCQSGAISDSALVLKIHTKAPRNIARKVELNVDSVRELLNPELIPGLLRQSANNPYFVSTFERYVGRTASWGTNISKYFQITKKLNLKSPPKKLRFPAGTIFWTTGAYVSYLGTLNIDRDDFEGEPSPDDGATEHVLERLFGMLAKDNGGVIPLEKLVTGGKRENRNLRN